jgi:ABC-type branched-subunit amino acid transport system substrate-binding protein
VSKLPAAFLAAAALAGCTARTAAPRATEPIDGRGRSPVVIPVVQGGEDDAGRLAGMQVAVGEVNRGGGIGGRPLRLRRVATLAEAIAGRPPSALVLGPAADAVTQRPEVEAARVPLVVFDDLYTGRSLYRYVFQAPAPAAWQADVLARYLEQRGVRGLGFTGPVAQAEPFLVAAQEEGLALDSSGDTVVSLDGTVAAGGQTALLPEAAFSASRLPPGTVTFAPYTWAGWAAPIPRVSRFLERYRERFGRPPSALEQEGYDAVRLLADALGRTEGRGGDALVRVMESTRRVTYSQIPIRLGPDDHVLAEESQLGLFAVAAPGEDREPWLRGRTPWRPVMRTFTYDGERVIILERDLPVFFPGWRSPEPNPYYWRSRYGIATRPSEDPLH